MGKKYYNPLFLLILVLLLFISCGRNRVYIPTITEDELGIVHYGKFVWYDLVTDDVPGARRFYENLFGWQFEGPGGDGAPYLTAYYQDQPIAGIVKSDRLEFETSEARWLGYISVPDVDRTTGQLLNMGGIVYNPPMDLEDRGRVAVVGDNRGAIFAIITAEGGDPEDQNPLTGTWLWSELLTDNPEKAQKFYMDIFGYAIEEIKEFYRYNYYILIKEGKRRAGLTLLPGKNVKPNWLPYIKVENPAETVRRAEELGGKILIVSESATGSAGVGIIADPTGAVFAVQKLPN